MALDLDAIAARAEAATAGPFVVKLGLFNEDGDLEASVRRIVDGEERYHLSFLTGIEPEDVVELDAWNPEISDAERAAAIASDGWKNAAFHSGARQDVLALVAEVEKLQAFKAYVHKRLDEAGVPPDPEPAENAKHGCRIEGRLNQVLGPPKRIAPPGGFVGKCPRCTRVPHIEIAAGQVIGNCAQCWLGEGVRVAFVPIEVSDG